MTSRIGLSAALLAALITNTALLGCGDAPISQARAQIDTSPNSAVKAEAPSAGPGAARNDALMHVRPVLIDDRIDVPQQGDSHG